MPVSRPGNQQNSCRLITFDLPWQELKVFDHIASAFNLNREDVDWEQARRACRVASQLFTADSAVLAAPQPAGRLRHALLWQPHPHVPTWPCPNKWPPGRPMPNRLPRRLTA